MKEGAAYKIQNKAILKPKSTKSAKFYALGTVVSNYEKRGYPIGLFFSTPVILTFQVE